ncbi:MAG: hypothetical protein ACLGSH_15235 [Acidobacteriota bacterium]
MASSFRYPECRHILPSGCRCKSPALRGRTLCFYHARASNLVEVNRPRKHSVALPPLEDRAAIQMSISEVVAALAAGKLSRREAGTYLYAIDLAGRTLTRIEQLPPPDPLEPEAQEPEAQEPEAQEPEAQDSEAGAPPPEPTPEPDPAPENPETDPLLDTACTHEVDPEPPPRLTRTEMKERVSEIELDLHNLWSLRASYADLPAGSDQKPEIILAYTKEKIEMREAELHALNRQDTPDPPWSLAPEVTRGGKPNPQPPKKAAISEAGCSG